MPAYSSQCTPRRVDPTLEPGLGLLESGECGVMLCYMAQRCVWWIRPWNPTLCCSPSVLAMRVERPKKLRIALHIPYIPAIRSARDVQSESSDYRS